MPLNIFLRVIFTRHVRVITIAVWGMISFLLAPGHARSQEIYPPDSITQAILESLYEEHPETLKSDSTRTASFNGYPYIYYTPETQLAFGAGGIFIFYSGNEKSLMPSKVSFGGYYSSNRQFKLSLNPSIYFLKNKIYVEAPVSYGYFINKYWGLGSEAPKNDSAAFSTGVIDAKVRIDLPPKIFTADRIGLLLHYNQTMVIDRMGNDYLYDSNLVGVDAGSILGIGANMIWDSRDQIFFPNDGGYQYFKIVFYPSFGDYVFSKLELDIRGYHAVAPDHVLAIQFYIESALGDTPFYQMPALGGQNHLRGYFNGRYRDNFSGMMQVEYRQYFWKRFGFVVFGGAGNVANNILEYDVSNIKYSYGGGLRYLMNEKQKVNLRMDIGIGLDGNRGVYFGIQEAF